MEQLVDRHPPPGHRRLRLGDLATPVDDGMIRIVRPVDAHHVLAAEHQFGLGRVLWMGTDNTWRWRRNTGVAASAAWYMIGCAALSFVAALVMHRYDGRILADLATDARAG